MRTGIVFLIYLVLGGPLCAQVPKSSYHVPNNSDVTKTISFSDRYLFETFRKGIVYLRTGGRAESLLNYSFFHGEIQFIDAKKDTLLLADGQLVSRIVIDDRIFFAVPEHGHIQQMAVYDKIRLGRKQKLFIADTQHQGAFGGYSSTSSISTYSTYTDARGHMQRLNPGSNVIMRKGITYFWIDQNQRFYPANKANLLKILPKKRREINDYFNANKVNFSNETEVIKLLEFCQDF